MSGRASNRPPLSPREAWLSDGRQVGRSCEVVYVETAVIVLRSGCLWLWGGAASAGTWGPVSSGMVRLIRGTYGGAVDGVCPLQEMTRQEHHIWSEVFEQEPDRQRAPLCCSGGGHHWSRRIPFQPRCSCKPVPATALATLYSQNWRYGAVLIDQHCRDLKKGLDNPRGGNRLQAADMSIMRFLAPCPGLSRLSLGICPLPLFSVSVALGAGRGDLPASCFGMT